LRIGDFVGAKFYSLQCWVLLTVTSTFELGRRC